MARTAHEVRSDNESDAYAEARSGFEALLGWIESGDATTHTELLSGLRGRGDEVLLSVLQGRLDSLFAGEKIALAASPRQPGVEVRARRRHLETDFGRATVRRHGHKEAGRPPRFPMDKALNLPPEVYALSLRKRVAEEARGASWDASVARIDATTSGHVPKRQAEALTVRAAQDVDAFYAQARAANDTVSPTALLVLTADAKGLTMRPEALREATRKEAEAAKADAVKGDPMARRKLRHHDKRMAIVTAVYDVEPHARTAEDIVAGLRPKKGAAAKAARKKARGPRPQNKRLAASVTRTQAEGIADMFDEADRRDPARERKTGVLIDGDKKLRKAAEHEATKRGRSITVIVDVIHVLHYLWMAGFALCRKDERATDAWVVETLFKLLTRHPLDVAAGIKQAATLRGLTKPQMKPVDKCIRYLRKNSVYIEYRRFLVAGFPIASGVIEGACRHLIQDRLGITGARWGLVGAEAILKLRSLNSSGDWDAYWNFHEHQQARRNYGAPEKTWAA